MIRGVVRWPTGLNSLQVKKSRFQLGSSHFKETLPLCCQQHIRLVFCLFARFFFFFFFSCNALIPEGHRTETHMCQMAAEIIGKMYLSQVEMEQTGWSISFYIHLNTGCKSMRRKRSQLRSINKPGWKQTRKTEVSRELLKQIQGKERKKQMAVCSLRSRETVGAEELRCRTAERKEKRGASTKRSSVTVAVSESCCINSSVC